MLFTLEALFAKHGDSLILHYGSTSEPKWILVDGGPPGIFQRSVEPRIQQIREAWGYEEDDSFPLDLVLVSHSDEDHIKGVLDLVDEQLSARSNQSPFPFRVRELWHNSFDDIIGSSSLSQSDLAALLAVAAEDAQESVAAVASVRQARDLRTIAEALNTKLNSEFRDLVMQEETGGPVVDLGHGLTFTILGPQKAQIDDYRERWKRDLEKVLANDEEAAKATAFADNSPFNLASIVVLAKLDDKTMLLTGDARGDFIIEGLKTAGFLNESAQPCRVDMLKVPHHGSSNNVTEAFFRRVEADHYVISGDGNHGNPETETLSMIAAARGDDEYTIHLTVTEDAAEAETNKKRKKALQRVMDWIQNSRPPNCKVVFRESPEALFVRVDLREPVDY